jgi:hypothetical protein
MTFIIDTLPDSLIYLILQELNGICLCRIAMVSKSLSNFANNDELWEFVYGFCKKDVDVKNLYKLQVPLKLRILFKDAYKILSKAKEEHYRVEKYKMYDDNLTIYEQKLAAAKKKKLDSEKTFRSYERAIAQWQGVEYMPMPVIYRT